MASLDLIDPSKKRVRDYLLAKYFQKDAPPPTQMADAGAGDYPLQPDRVLPGVPAAPPPAPPPPMQMPDVPPPPPADEFSPEARAKLSAGNGGGVSMIGDILAGLGDALASSRGTGGTKFYEASRASGEANRTRKLAEFDLKKKAVQDDAVRKYLSEKYNIPATADADSAQKLAQLSSTDENRDATREATAESRKVREDRMREGMSNTETERDERQNERRKTRFIGYFQSLEQKDPVIKELRKQEIGLDQVNSLYGLIKEGNTVAASALGTKMARGMGEVGVLTESDISRYVQSGRLDRKVADKMSKMLRGVPTDTTLEEIKQITDALKGNFQEKIQPRYDQFIRTYANIEKMAPEAFAAELAINYGGGAPATPPPATPPPATVDDGAIALPPDKAKRLVALRKKKAEGKIK